MGWFDTPDESEPAAQHALRVARKKSLSLPMTVRSRTQAEFLGFHRRHAWFLAAIYIVLVGGIIIGLALDGGQQSRDILKVAAPFSALCGLLLVALFWWKLQRHRDYRDPGLAIDIGADGIIVRGAGGDYGMRWHEIDVQFNWMRVKNGIYFIGLWLQSPLGLVDLKDETYRHGRNAAALIVRGLHDAYHARQRAKIERIG
jgi:hypothetical protein